MPRRNWITLSPFALALALASSGCSSGAEDESAADGSLALSGAFALYHVTPDADPARLCYQAVGSTAQPRCELPSFTSRWSDEERTRVMEAVKEGRLVARAKLTKIDSPMIGKITTWETQDVWLAPKTSPASAGKLYQVRRDAQGFAATLAGSTTKVNVDSLDLGAAGSPAELQEAQEDLADADGMLVAGKVDAAAGTLKVERPFVKLRHLLTLYETWVFEQGPGDVMNGATYQVPPTAKVELTLDEYAANPPEPTKKDLDHIAGFTVVSGPPSLVVKDTTNVLWNCPNDADRNQPGCAGGSYAQTMRWFSFVVPKGATAGQTWTIKSQPKPGSENNPKWDFSFTIKVGSSCRSTYPTNAKPGSNDACF